MPVARAQHPHRRNRGATSIHCWTLWPLMFALSLLIGCTSWTGLGSSLRDAGSKDLGKSKVPGLPSAKVPDHAAILDIAFLELPSSTVVKQGELPWDVMDHSVIPLEVRSRLEANGFRVGRIMAFDTSQLPQTSDDEENQANAMGWTSDFDRRVRRLACTDGQPYKLVMRRAASGEVATLIRGPTGVSGRSVWDPQFNFGLRTTRMDDGRVAVKLVPEIHHGEVKRSFISNDSLAFRMDSSRDVWVLNELAIEVPLDEGQAVVILPQDAGFGLAKQMLVGRKADDSEERTAVVVHLSRRPQNGLGGSR